MHGVTVYTCMLIQLVIGRPEFAIPCIRSHNNFFRGVSIDTFTNCQVCYLVVAVIFCMHAC